MKNESNAEGIPGVNNLMQILTARLQETADELGEKIQKMVAKKAESVKVDLEMFFQTIDLMKEADADPRPRDFQELFYSRWLNSLPEKKMLLAALAKEDFSALEIKNYVLGMGQKAKAARDGFCVSLEIAPICSSCYFRDICQCKEKN